MGNPTANYSIVGAVSPYKSLVPEPKLNAAVHRPVCITMHGDDKQGAAAGK